MMMLHSPTKTVSHLYRYGASTKHYHPSSRSYACNHAQTWNEKHVVVVHGMDIPGRPQKSEQSTRITRSLRKPLVSLCIYRRKQPCFFVPLWLHRQYERLGRGYFFLLIPSQLLA